MGLPDETGDKLLEPWHGLSAIYSFYNSTGGGSSGSNGGDNGSTYHFWTV
jgi:hypothetical protein